MARAGFGRVGLGIVGCGVIGKRHIANGIANPDARLAAICDADGATLASAAESAGEATTYTDAGALLADPAVDAVVVALPAGVRQPVALAALGAGKHLLTEKPVGMDAGEVADLIAAQDGLIAGCASSRQRFLQSAAVATRVIADGVLGDIRLVRGRGVAPAPAKPAGALPSPWRLRRSANGGGIMANWGCYDLDFLLGITGWTLRPERVFAQTWSIAPELRAYVVPDSDAETHVVALIRCAGGIALALERGEYLPAERDGAWEVIGTRGSLRLSMVPVPGNAVRLDRLDDSGVLTETVYEGAEGWDVGHAGVLDDFVAAVGAGSEPATTLRHALVVQQLTDAIYASAQSGAAVAIDSPAGPAVRRHPAGIPVRDR